MKPVVGVAVLVLVLAAGLGAELPPPGADVQRAQFSLPTGAGADWQQWDSFLTNAIKKMAQDLGPQRREQLRDLFLDSRYQLVQALSSGPDPVPRLFLDTWNRLAPILKQAVPGLPAQTASQYRGFISAMDSAASLGGVGQRFGLVQVSPDMLRGASKLLGAGGADPLEYTLDVDSALRTFLGFTGALPSPRVSPAIEQGTRRPTGGPGQTNATAAMRWWFVTPASAAPDDLDRLNQWVPQAAELNDYLAQVRKLLVQASAGPLAKSKLAPQYHALYRHIIFTAAWQESCWRQLVRKGEKLTPLASATGDVGMMQVNRKTWRGLYDLNGLAGDMGYNTNAGSEILLYYLTRYAIAKKEDKQPGGQLARATYSAYNGGPRHLGRYRNAPNIPALKKVDEAFWTKFRTVSAGQELAVKSCYGP
jgi:hypothetical protein